jgi:hypothetical protein
MRRPNSILGLLITLARIGIWHVPSRRRALLSGLALAALGTLVALARPAHRDEHRRHALASFAVSSAALPALAGRCLESGTHCARDAECQSARCVLPFVPRTFRSLRSHAGTGLALSPSLAWNGDGYGVVWVDLREGQMELYFARLSREGVRQGNEVRLTTAESLQLAPHLVWNGREYAVTWTEAGDESLEVYLARLSPAGASLGTPVRLSSSAEYGFASRAAWNGREYGVAWYSFRPGAAMGLRFARVAATGERIGAERAVLDGLFATGALDLAWNGSEYGLAWSEYDAGTHRASSRLLQFEPEGRVTAHATFATEQGINGNTAVAWDGRVFGLVWEDALSEDGPNALCFGSVSRRGIDVPRAPLTDRKALTLLPSLAWNERHYGLAWTDDRTGGFDTWFARLTPRGKFEGAPLRLSTPQGEAVEPSVSGNGSEFGVAWIDTREGDLGLYFARISREGTKVGRDVRLNQH